MRIQTEDCFEMRQGLRRMTCEFENSGKGMPCQRRTRIERNGALYALERGLEVALGPQPAHAPQALRKPLAVIAQDGLFGGF
jgi:hypothetical protein